MDYRYKCEVYNCKTFFEKNIGEKSSWPIIRKQVLQYDTKGMIYKRKIQLLDSFKIKLFCSVKNYVKKMKRQPTDLQKMFASHISDKIHIQNI